MHSFLWPQLFQTTDMKAPPRVIVQNTSTNSRFPTTFDAAEKTGCHGETVLLSTAAKINSVLHVSAVSSGYLRCCTCPSSQPSLTPDGFCLFVCFRSRSVNPRNHVVDQQQVLKPLHWPRSTTFPLTLVPVSLQSDTHTELQQDPAPGSWMQGLKDSKKKNWKSDLRLYWIKCCHYTGEYTGIFMFFIVILMQPTHIKPRTPSNSLPQKTKNWLLPLMGIV